MPAGSAGGELAEDHRRPLRRVRGAEAEEHAGDAAVRAGDEHMAPGLRLEALRLDEAPLRRPQPLKRGVERLRLDGVDRDSLFEAF